MTKTAPFSTVEQFAQNAGIPGKIGRLIAIGEDRFVVTSKSGVYEAFFLKDNAEVAYFSSPILGHMLTREEAQDTMAIIEYCLTDEQRKSYAPILERLNNNIPQLGFRLDTPLMDHTYNGGVWHPSLDCDSFNR